MADLIPRPKRVRRRRLLTLADVVDHLLLLDEMGSERTAVRRAVKAAQTAIARFASFSDAGFKYYHAREVLSFNASINLGEITVSGGVVTPTNGMPNPDWLPLGHVRIDRKSYPICEVNNGGIGSIDIGGSFVVGGAGGASLTIDTDVGDGVYQEVTLEQLYNRLPHDFRRRGSINDNQEFFPITNVHAGILQSWSDFFEWARSSLHPRIFASISADQRFQGEHMLAIWPPYSTGRTVQMFYERYPAELRIHRATAANSGPVRVDGKIGRAHV